MLTGSLKNCSAPPTGICFRRAGRGLSLDAMALFFKFQKLFFLKPGIFRKNIFLRQLSPGKTKKWEPYIDKG
jgi:hypothetical protein